MKRFPLHTSGLVATILLIAMTALAPDSAHRPDSRIQQRNHSKSHSPAWFEAETTGRSESEESNGVRKLRHNRFRFSLPQHQDSGYIPATCISFDADLYPDSYVRRSSIPDHIRLDVYLLNSVLLI